MIKEALQYIVGMSGIHTLKYDEELYSDKEVHRVPKELPCPDMLVVNTLSGFMDYVKANELNSSEALYIQIVSPTEVRLVSTLNNDNERSTYIKAKALLPEQHFGTYMSQEAFLIYLRTAFVESDNRNNVIEFCGCVTGNDVSNYEDDGVSQKVSVSTHVGTKDAIAPTDPMLQPFRTFIDVEQPDSHFIFRAKKMDNAVGFALYEADGGAWKIEAMNNIRKYIDDYMCKNSEEFSDIDIIVIC